MKLKPKNVKLMNLTNNVSKRIYLLLFVVGASGCFNCEDHINNDIKPMFLRAKITAIDTIEYRPLKLYFSSQKLGERSIQFNGCSYLDVFQITDKIQIGDSLIKEVGTDTFKIKQNTNKIYSIRYHCCVR